MAFKLATDEHIVKQWNYGTVKTGRTKTNAELIVTDKRIVSITESKIDKNVTEIPMDSVNSVNYHRGRSSLFNKIIGVLEIIVGIPFSILIVGIGWIKDGIRRIKAGEFSLEITTRGTADALLTVGMQRGRLRKATGRIKVWMDKAAVEEIGEEIGSIIFSHK